MKAAVLYSKKDLRYEEIKKPIISKDEVLIKVMASGICGSDIPRVLSDDAHFYPIVLGHEFSGRVFEIGSNVENIKVGDNVTCAPLIPCHECEDCKSGNHALCKDYSFIGSRRAGSFAEYIKVPKINIVKLANNISFEEGAFFEPSTVALHGLRRLNFQKGKNVAVIGAGTVGLFVIQWAKIFGAKKVFVFDIDENRLSIAKELGVDEIINLSENDSGNKFPDFDYIYDVVGKSSTIKLSLDLVSNKGDICVVGTSSENINLSSKEFQWLNRKEATLTGSWMSYSAPFPGDEWDLTSKLFSTGELRVSQNMIFKKFPLSKAKEAFELFEEPEKIKGKILLLNEMMKDGA